MTLWKALAADVLRATEGEAGCRKAAPPKLSGYPTEGAVLRECHKALPDCRFLPGNPK
jgi:hypothetical protein